MCSSPSVLATAGPRGEERPGVERERVDWGSMEKSWRMPKAGPEGNVGGGAARRGALAEEGLGERGVADPVAEQLSPSDTSLG